ncbi:MAG: ABC transporter ATP-binding protein [Firmicutes bacterium]|nr:ABC transporter ATP-binding protein [Bacillota bacterium]
MSQVDLVEVTKTFPGGVKAVDGVSLTVRQGEFLTLLGPSGCGKTTSLRMIAGFEQPDAGRVLIGGRDVTRVPPYERDTGMVFQSLALFPHMSVLDNVLYGLRMRGVSRTEAERRAREMLALVQLSGYEHRRPHQLSGGQRQRVAFARALAVNPSIFLLDEPFAALDAKIRDELQVELRRLQQRVGITTVFVTHNQREAMTLSDRIAVMRDGRIEQIGSPQEIYEDPATVFVAGFVGMTNLFRGHVVERAGRRVRVKTEEGFVVEAELGAGTGNGASKDSAAAGDVAPGKPVTVSVRPESVRLEPRDQDARGGSPAGVDPSGGGQGGIPVTVDLIRFVGELIEYHLYTPGGQEIIGTYQRGQRTLSMGQGGAAIVRFDPKEARVLWR